jgi:ATP synthase protein I
MTSAGDDSPDKRKKNERLKERLNQLEIKLGERESGGGGLTDEEAAKRGSALGKALQLSVEMVAGVFAGGAIGWALDAWLGTSPLFLLVFLLLGIAAGFLNVIRAARAMSGK